MAKSLAGGLSMQVEIVDADNHVWKGEATMVRARTTEGEIGILPNHTPMLTLMLPGELIIKSVDEGTLTYSATGGFFSVDQNVVTIVGDGIKAVER